jgi:hypothetical protein
MRALLLAIVLLTACSPQAAPGGLAAGENVQDLAPADPRASAILSALNRVVAEDLGQDVLLKTEVLRVGGGYAYFVGEPRTMIDQPIDFTTTRYKAEMDEGLFDGARLSAYLREEKDGWKVLAFAQGPTDLPDVGWPDEYGGPFALLGLPPIPEGP